MIDLILRIVLIVLVLALNILVIIFYRDVNKEFTSIYCRLFDLEKRKYDDDNNSINS